MWTCNYKNIVYLKPERPQGGKSKLLLNIPRVALSDVLQTDGDVNQRHVGQHEVLDVGDRSRRAVEGEAHGASVRVQPVAEAAEA